MTDNARKYLSDIAKAISLVEAFVADTRGFAAYQRDLKTKSAVERQLGILGEAVNHYRREAPTQPLSHTKPIVDFRNRLIHAYDSLDDSIVWAILQNHLPVLKAEVGALLNS